MVYASYLQACLQAIQKQFWVWSRPGLDSLLSWMEMMMITRHFPNIKRRVEDLKRNQANQQILESTLLTWSAIIRRAAQEENPSRRGCLSPLFKSFSCNPQNIKGGFQNVCFCLCYTNQGFTFYILSFTHPIPDYYATFSLTDNLSPNMNVVHYVRIIRHISTRLDRKTLRRGETILWPFQNDLQLSLGWVGLRHCNCFAFPCIPGRHTDTLNRAPIYQHWTCTKIHKTQIHKHKQLTCHTKHVHRHITKGPIYQLWTIKHCLCLCLCLCDRHFPQHYVITR